MKESLFIWGAQSYNFWKYITFKNSKFFPSQVSLQKFHNIIIFSRVLNIKILFKLFIQVRTLQKFWANLGKARFWNANTIIFLALITCQNNCPLSKIHKNNKIMCGFEINLKFLIIIYSKKPTTWKKLRPR